MSRVSGGDGIHIGDLWNTGNDSSSQLDLLVSLDHVENSSAILGEQTDESLHVGGVVLASNMALGVNESKNVSFSFSKVLNGGHDTVYKKIKKENYFNLFIFLIYNLYFI